MKKTKFIITAMVASILFTNCLGSFSAFNGLKDWNHQVTDNKFVNNLLFWGLNIIPVYGLFFLGDLVIFNVVEFWSGSNPLAMNEGDMEEQIVKKDGNTYKMIATKNQMDIKVVEGKDEGKSVEMFYTLEDKTWRAKTDDGEIIKLSSMKDGFQMVYLPNGEEVKLAPNTSQEDGKAIINAKIAGIDMNKGFVWAN